LNLSEITNVNDLIEANQVAPDCDTTLVDTVLDMINNDDDITPNQVLSLAMNLVAQVGAQHVAMAENLVGDPERVKVRDIWVADEQKLHTAWDLLNEVYSAE
jgi:hypothetical protein